MSEDRCNHDWEIWTDRETIYCRICHRKSTVPELEREVRGARWLHNDQATLLRMYQQHIEVLERKLSEAFNEIIVLENPAISKERTSEMVQEQLLTIIRKSGGGVMKPENDEKLNELMATAKRFVKKPVEIKAFQTDVLIEIETLEGIMTAYPGDWIIQGVKGEMYPCRPDIFELTYDPVT